MKLDFNFNIVRSNGQELDGVPQAIADLCEFQQQGDYKKYVEWAKDITKDGTLDIDKHNIKELRQMIEVSSMRAIVKDQIINYIDSINNKKDGN